MSNHNITSNFGSVNEEPKTPWYKRKLTYFIAVPVLLVIIIVNGINGERGTPPGAEPEPAPVATGEPEVVEPAEPVEAEPEPDPIQVEPAPTTEEMALIVLRDGWPYFAAVTDAAINEAAIAACDGFDSGIGWDTYIIIAAGSNIPAEEAGALAGYAVAVYCPQHEGIAEGY